MADAACASSLRLLKLMPFKDINANVYYLSNFVDPDELSARVDVPLPVATDTEAKKPFLTCDYNRDEDSHRSPHTNKYFPPLEDVDDPTLPPDHLRKIEIIANELAEEYAHLYFGKTAVASVYMFEISDIEFGACWLIKKGLAGVEEEVSEGNWDSKHIFQITKLGDNKWKYSLQSNVILTLTMESATAGKVQLGGHVQSSKTQDCVAKRLDDQVKNMGKMVEDADSNIRSNVDSMYLGKVRTVTGYLRGGKNAGKRTHSALGKDLAAFMKANVRK